MADRSRQSHCLAASLKSQVAEHRAINAADDGDLVSCDNREVHQVLRPISEARSRKSLTLKPSSLWHFCWSQFYTASAGKRRERAAGPAKRFSAWFTEGDQGPGKDAYKMVGGPGFEPGASRSRNLLVVSPPLPHPPVQTRNELPPGAGGPPIHLALPARP